MSRVPDSENAERDERDEEGADGEGSRGAEVAAALTAEDEPRDVAQQVEDLNPADGAAVLQDLPRELSAEVTEYLDPETAAQILVEMDPHLAATVIMDMEVPEASMVLAAMDPDDRVDILGHVPEPMHQRLLDEMTVQQVSEVRRLEQYPPDTAGGIMTTEVTALPEDLTVEEAVSELRRLNEQLEQMFYVYAVDKRGHLVGVLSMRDLILAKPGTRLAAIMKGDVLSVPATMDQEEVARRFRKYGYLAMPVTDDRGRLTGIITVDDVVDVMEEEATEDVQRMFGAGAEERLNSPWLFSFQRRVWWLVINLFTAFLAAGVVAAYGKTIQALVALAVYMPVVAGTGGNASAQAMAVAVRGIAIGRVDRSLLRHVILRELRVGMATGVTIGTITGAIAVLFHRQAMLGLVVGLALVINHTCACASGATIPFLMKRLGFDPAQSSTIFATTITDVVGFFALLGLAQVLLV
jgi:magnesium transporter